MNGGGPNNGRNILTAGNGNLYGVKMALATKRYVDSVCRRDPEHPRRLAQVVGDTFPWNKIVFGYTLALPVLTVLAGEVHHATAAVDIVAEKDLDFTGLNDDDYYIFVEYTIGAGAAWANPNTTRPINDTTIFRVWFYVFTWADPALTRKSIGHMGNIELPSTFET